MDEPGTADTGKTNAGWRRMAVDDGSFGKEREFLLAVDSALSEDSTSGMFVRSEVAQFRSLMGGS
ncbi:hypothetical protein ABZ930_27240 [Streptomyces sp. NPDC046716]|uniref:hypothetical protein n=1 Tax=Streptomyces sp. NPDC046716 TaxID=3157093 RepID=UPI0034048623